MCYQKKSKFELIHYLRKIGRGRDERMLVKQKIKIKSLFSYKPTS